MANISKMLGTATNILMHLPLIKRVTYYDSPKLVIKVTRQHQVDLRQCQESYTLTIGKPNYKERIFIKAAQKANEPFPIKKLQLKPWPKARV